MAGLVDTGGFETHLDRIVTADWVIEAVVERVDVKQQLLARVDERRRPGTIVRPTRRASRLAPAQWPRISAATGSARTSSHRRAISASWSSSRRRTQIRGHRRGHQGRRHAARQRRRRRRPELHRQPHRALRRRVHAPALSGGRYSIEEIDAITGPAIGRPGSATFRTIDIAGVDVLAHVMRNLHETGRAATATPSWFRRSWNK